MANTIDNSNNIILGSGELYGAEFTGEIPADATIETDDNRLGNIKGGATLEYSTTSQTVQSDNGKVKKTIVTEEDVKFKTGMITWAENWLKVLISTARVDTTTTAGHKVTKIGGLDNKHGKSYLLRFVHKKSDGNKIRVTVTGRNTGTVTFAFTADNAQQVDAEITAEALDDTGTLVIFDEEVDTTSDEATTTEETSE